MSPADRPGWMDQTSGTVHALVTAAAVRFPDAVAITTEAESVTYRELLRRAHRLAGRLREAGARPGVHVGVFADRCVETVVAFLGVLFTGAAYVPVDPDLPVSRRRFIAEQADLRLFTGAARTAGLAEAAAFIPAEADTGDPAPDPGPAGATDTAYIIFTSGTTSASKGVVVEHGAVVASTAARFGVYPWQEMAYLVCAPPTVDSLVAGLYFTLSAGGRVVLPTDEEVFDPGLLGELVARERVTHIDALPSQYAALLDYDAKALSEVRCVLLGGDVLPHALVRAHLDALPQVALHNEYGPTEATVWCATHRCGPDDDGPGVPIGRPAPGMRVTVRSTATAAEVPAGTTGEICIAGPWLARGYLGRPGLTAAAFVPDPDHAGERMYRTSDLGYLDAHGELNFLGRADDVVKVRGFRVGLTEVEARLLEHPAVRGAAVIAQPNGTDTRLVAVVVLTGAPDTGRRELADFLGARLPSYMVPTRWRSVEALPTSAAGKVDRPYLTSAGGTVGTALPP